MKKSLKLWLLATGIVAMSLLCNGLTTNAATNTATLKINTWANTCTWADYDFGAYNVSATATELTEQVHELTCHLLANAAKTVQLQIGATLTSEESNTIPGSSFTVATNIWTTNGTLEADTAESAAAFTTARTVYDKWANKIWDLTITQVTIDGTIPAGTPSWVYTWDLNVTF